MTEAAKQFLFLLKTHVNNETIPDGYHFDIGRVFSLAKIHNVLPMVYDAAAKSAENVSFFRNEVVMSVGHQMIKNNAFRFLYNNIKTSGIDIIVVKGPVCSSCYNNPDYRLSSDFDIVVKKSQKESLERYLCENDFQKKGESFYNPVNGLYIEVSTELGEGNNDLKNIADDAFEGFFDRIILVDGYSTLDITDHFVYLIYHAYKHFIESGFGIRQIIDILLFAKKYKLDIDIDLALEMLKKAGAYTFACNVFCLIESVFDFCFDLFDFKADESILCLDGFAEDVLSAGVFGKSSEDRLHSATLVTAAVSGEEKSGLIKTAFPSYKVMKARYSVLKYLPVLLPVIWLFRLIQYIFKVISKNNNVSPLKTVEIANSRIDLMRKMGIINKQSD